MVVNTYEVYDVYERMVLHMDLEDSLVDTALAGNKKAKDKIASEFSDNFSRGKKRKIYIHFRNLEFLKLTDNQVLFKEPKSSFAHRTDSLSACDNPHCVDCENGHYERCRYR